MENAVKIRLGERPAAHLYELEVEPKDGVTPRVQVDANNRDQAARIAEQAGYVVRSVNMVG